MIGKRGQLFSVLSFLAPFIFFAILLVIGAFVVSILRLPLALAGGIMSFLYVAPLLRKADIRKNYALIGAGILGLVAMVIIYRLPLFWLMLAIGGMWVIYQLIHSIFGISTLGGFRRLFRKKGRKIGRKL